MFYYLNECEIIVENKQLKTSAKSVEDCIQGFGG